MLQYSFIWYAAPENDSRATPLFRFLGTQTRNPELKVLKCNSLVLRRDGGMDPYSSPYVIPQNRPYKSLESSPPFPPKHQGGNFLTPKP